MGVRIYNVVPIIPSGGPELSSAARFLFLGVFLLSAVAGAEERLATELTFTETDPYIDEPYQTRMLVTPDYLRMDDGNADDDFVLLDRKTRTIYSVSHEEQRVVVVPDRKVTTEPGIKLEHRRTDDGSGGSPSIAGRRVHQFHFYTNGDMCYEVHAVKGFLPDVVKAMSSYAEVLAGQHELNLADMPKDLQAACDLANNIYEPTRYLSEGFPIRQRDDVGRSRNLQGFRKNVKVKSELFVIPEKYERFYPGKTMM